MNKKYIVLLVVLLLMACIPFVPSNISKIYETIV